MLNCIVVGLGGFIGSVMRYLISMIPIKNPVGFPINTCIINILGALLIGYIVGAASRNTMTDPRLILFLKTGICGGFTTFSTFALETADLMKAGKTEVALVYMMISAAAGILAVFAGENLIK